MRECRIHIVESPSADDFLVEQYEGPTLRTALQQAQLSVHLHTAVDAQHLGKALARVIDDYMQNQNAFPILHLSMHGSNSGVTLTSGEKLDWNNLGASLSLVNEALNDKLLVAMSTCKGFNGASMARRQGHLPFFALIGPKDNVSWRDTVAAFVAFYHHLIARDGTIVSGVQLINDLLGVQLFQAQKGEDELTAWKAGKAADDEAHLRQIAEKIVARWRQSVQMPVEK
jgi:hypothetical protein